MSTANAAARHNHPIPIESKMDSKLKLDIDEALEVDPSVTPHIRGKIRFYCSQTDLIIIYS